MELVGRERRRFLQQISGSILLAAAGAEGLRPLVGKASMRWPKPIGSPVLESLRPVIEHSRDVRTNGDKIVEVAGWMAYEELPLPEFAVPFGVGANNPNEAIDFILVANSIDTAFTDFSTHIKFQVDFTGQHLSLIHI